MFRQLCCTLMIVSFVAGGCASPIVGTPLLAPRCDVNGYEDLLSTDGVCIQERSKPRDVSPGWSLRNIDINGQQVRYSILRNKSRNRPPPAPDEDSVQVRWYRHAGVYGVERMQKMDAVLIYVSDVCLVEEYTTNPSPDIECNIQSVSQRSIETHEARVVLPQATVDDLELQAFNSGRSTQYTLTVITPVIV